MHEVFIHIKNMQYLSHALLISSASLFYFTMQVFMHILQKVPFIYNICPYIKYVLRFKMGLH